jgi:hypothetical protein
MTRNKFKTFCETSEKIATVLDSRSIDLRSTFISKDEVLKKYFENTSVKINSFHTMRFAKFS